MSQHGLLISARDENLSIPKTDDMHDAPALASTQLTGAVTEKVAKDTHPQETILDFLKAFEDELGSDDEFDELTRTFLEEERHASTSGVRSRKARRAKDYPRLQCLVSKLEQGRVADSGASMHDDVAHTLAALRVLQQILELLGGFPVPGADVC